MDGLRNDDRGGLERQRLSGWVALGVGAAVALGGCGGGGGGPRNEPRPLATPNRPVWQQPKPGAAPAEVEEAAPTIPSVAAEDGREALSSYAMDLQSLFEQIKAPPEEAEAAPTAAPPTAAPRQTPAATAQVPTNPEPAPAASVAAGAAPGASQEPETAVEPSRVTTDSWAPGAEGGPVEWTPEERRADLLSQLTLVLGRAAGQPEGLGGVGGVGPLGRAVRLAALEAVEPGVAKAELDRLEAELLPSEAAVLRPLRELFARLGGSAAGEGDPAAIAALMDEYSRRLAQARPLSLPTAVLCERVESFGRYTPLPTTTFAAGQGHSAILYVEVESFMQRTAPGDGPAVGGPAVGGAEQWITELGQSLDLHHDADGSLQWRQAEQVVRDGSRRRRSDYYLVQRISLPPTLSVGRYNLKITVNDKVSGATAQARIPIQIVADASLAKSP